MNIGQSFSLDVPSATFIFSSLMLIYPNIDFFSFFYFFFNVFLTSAFMQQDEEDVYFADVNGLPECKMDRLQMNPLLEAQPSNRNYI